MRIVTIIMIMMTGWLVSAACWAATFTVTSTADSGTGSLREAIGLANAASDLDTIVFNTGLATIMLSSDIDITNPVIVDGGGTQEISTNTNFVYLISMNTSNATGTIIKNIALTNGYIGIYSSSVNNLTITGCRIGLDWAGNTYNGNTYGMTIYNCSNLQIGGSASTDRNLFACNSDSDITASQVSDATIVGNYFGVSPDGLTAMPRVSQSVKLVNSNQCRVGGDRAAGFGNVISGASYGVVIDGGFGNTICGNIIGLNADQSQEIPNYIGIKFEDTHGHYLGLSQLHYENIIAGSDEKGVYLDEHSSDIIIQNNIIGMTSSEIAYENNTGIAIFAENVLVGGYRNTSYYQRNIISGNRTGVFVGADSASICGNYIGTGLDGNSIIGNTTGIAVRTTYGSIIGGPNSHDGQVMGNVIAGCEYGIYMQDGGGNTVVGNSIGLSASGTTGLANDYGMSVHSSDGVFMIGGSNTMVANHFGISNYNQFITESSTQAHRVQGNFFGMNYSGTAALAHTGFSHIYNLNSTGLVIGGSGSGEGNRIAGYGRGVYIQDSSGNTIVGNVMGLLADGYTMPAQRLITGIELSDCTEGNFIGIKNTMGNIISGVTSDGLYISSGSQKTGVYNNTITACSTAYRHDSGVNNNKAAPVITTALPGMISGTSDANDYVEVFLSDGVHGASGGSMCVIGYTTADGSGNWSITPSGLVYGNVVTAIATDNLNNSSPFATNMELLVPTATFTTTPTFTVTLTPSPTLTATPTSTITWTYSPTLTITPSCTITLTHSPTLTATVTSTGTPTSSPTGSPTATPSWTVTETITPTPTVTMTTTGTPADTATQTATRTVTATITPTATVSPTATVTPTATSTVTFLPTVTVTPEPERFIKSFIYPNPAMNEVYFAIPLENAGKVVIQIYNIDGERVGSLQRYSTISETIRWDCSAIGPGIYIAKISRNGKEPKLLKIAIVK